MEKKILGTIAELNRNSTFQTAFENQLEGVLTAWFEQIREKLLGFPGNDADIRAYVIILSSLVVSLRQINPSRVINKLIGKGLTILSALECALNGENRILKHLLGSRNYSRAKNENTRILVLNPGSTSTKIAFFEGMMKQYETNIYISPDEEDSIEERTASIMAWFKENNLSFDTLDGIACRGGFISPVPTGTYRVTEDMLKDLIKPRIVHASNMSIPIGFALAGKSAPDREILVTTTDPVVCDEIDIVDRLTGCVQIKKDGTGTHYLNHKALAKYVASLTGADIATSGFITAHLGGGMSVARHVNGRVVSVLDAFSGIPSANRAGQMDMPRILKALKSNEMTVKELRDITFNKGGLLSLAGTNDFRAMINFLSHGASATQQEKIWLILEFYARKITAAVYELAADGHPVDTVIFSGGLMNASLLVSRIEKNIGGAYPAVFIPGSIEHESLAAGLVKGLFEPESLKDYKKEKDNLARHRKASETLIDTTIFERKILYTKTDTPVTSLDQLIDLTCLLVKDHAIPSVAIVGADNEDVLKAAKEANHRGDYKISNFNLIGDAIRIAALAEKTGVLIDNGNYRIIDTDNPVEKAISLYDDGEIQLLMKGNVKTEKILHEILRYLKSAGKLPPDELVSQVVVMDIPTRNKLLLFSDAAINAYPDTEKRVKIINNTLKVARSLNIVKPKVAVISAIEKVNKSVESSIEAREIARLFEGRTDCIVEGPLSFDVAVDRNIAEAKGYQGKIRGTADILILPDIDAGNVLYKTLTTQLKASCASIILCGDVPMILTSRSDSARTKLASIAMAVKLFFDYTNRKPKGE